VGTLLIARRTPLRVLQHTVAHSRTQTRARTQRPDNLAWLGGSGGSGWDGLGKDEADEADEVDVDSQQVARPSADAATLAACPQSRYRKWADLPVRGKPVLKMLGLVVLGGEGPLVEGVLGRVSLRRGLDVHEGHRGGGALARRAAAAAAAPGTGLITVAEGTSGAAGTASVHGAFLAPWQQLDALHASIPVEKAEALGQLQSGQT
jgi:hypothetical protein